MVSAYTIAFAALILTAGALGDPIGAKRIFMAGLPFSRQHRLAAHLRRAPARAGALNASLGKPFTLAAM